MGNTMNRIFNADNPFQGKARRVLCCCSAGLLRSPTAAVVLSQEPFNFNTRAAGVEESFALVPVDPVLVTWADEIVVMTLQHRKMLEEKVRMWNENGTVAITLPDIKVLNIEDSYEYMDPELVRAIKERYTHIK